MTTSGAQQGIRPGVCLSTSRPASPYIGQIIYMTDVNQSAVWDGTSWSGLDRSRDRNVIINGAMQITQRGTSTTGKTGGGYATVDRFQAVISSLGTWTETVENDAPTGSGFRKSWKLACTTANASPAAGNYMVAYQIIEGQNLQHFAKGTASAKQFTLSFWVKGTTIGTYVVELYDNNNTRSVSASYTISAPDTWEKKILVFPSDTTGTLTNDNGNSLTVQWWLGAGSTFTAGSLATSWGAVNNSNRAVGQTNLAGATSRSWQITGVQFEAGAVATPFEFEDYQTTLTKCQRYYCRINAGFLGSGMCFSTSAVDIIVHFPVPMRAAPSAVETTGTSSNYLQVTSNTGTQACNSGPTFVRSSQYTAEVTAGSASTGLVQGNATFLLTASGAVYLGFSAEL